MNSTTWIISPNWIAWTLLGVATASLVAIVVCSIVFIRRNNPSKNQDSTSPIGSPQNAQEIHRLKSSITVLSVVVTIIFVWLCYACWCDLKFGSDSSAGSLMTALGIMVTALLGWQVFNAIENSKTLRKLDRLENKLRTQIEVHEKWNNEVFDMIEANMAIREADKTTDYATKYFNYAKALALYLRGNVDVSHSFIKTKIPYLSTILSQVERSNDDDKILFARQMSGLDDLHETLLDTISDREENLKVMRRKIIDLRVRRNNLFGKFVGLETSVERLIREEQAKRKAKDSHNPPS